MEYIAEQHRALLNDNALDTFNRVWAHEMEWFEAPNVRRGGWSGVGCFTINSQHGQHQDGAARNVFLKKQQNHGRPTFLHPIQGEPTFRREFFNLRFLEKKQFLAPEVIFYAESSMQQARCAVLMTRALDGFQPLDDFLKNRPHSAPFIKKVAQEVRRFHDLGLVHRALYPKHIFIKTDDAIQIAVIDLEKARHVYWRWYATFFDLAALHRHTKHVRKTLRMRFFLSYMHIETLSPWSKILLRMILRRSRR